MHHRSVVDVQINTLHPNSGRDEQHVLPSLNPVASPACCVATTDFQEVTGHTRRRAGRPRNQALARPRSKGLQTGPPREIQEGCVMC